MANENENKGVIEAIDRVEKSLQAAVAERDAEIKELGQATEKTGARIEDLHKELTGLRDDVEGEREERKNLEGRLAAFNDVRADSRKSLGQRFADSDEYKEYVKNGMSGKSQHFEVGHAIGGIEEKATVLASDLSTADIIQASRVANFVREPDRSYFVRTLIPTYGTETGSVEYTRETSFTNNAGMVPEFSATDTTEKPESGITFDLQSVPVRTMAHWIPITRQAAADARQIRAYVENRLFYGLRLKEDQQILYGTGTGNELQGILTTAGIKTFTQGTDGEAGDTKIDTLRRALTLSWVDEYRPSGIVMHQSDWEDVELTKGSDGHYIYVNVQTQNGQRLWGVPIVLSNAIEPDTALVGDFQRGTAIHDRENAILRVSDSHGSFFTQNLLALLVEERLAQTIYRPNAFVDVSFTP